MDRRTFIKLSMTTAAGLSIPLQSTLEPVFPAPKEIDDLPIIEEITLRLEESREVFFFTLPVETHYREGGIQLHSVGPDIRMECPRNMQFNSLYMVTPEPIDKALRSLGINRDYLNIGVGDKLSLRASKKGTLTIQLPQILFKMF